MAKSSAKPPLRICFFRPNDFEYVYRLADGILQYQADHRNCVIRDYHYDSKATENREEWARRPRPWEEWEPDGLIVNISGDPGLAEWVGARGIPVVNTSSSSTHLPSVYISFDGVARLAMEHFEKLGFKHFASMSCEGEDRRVEAFKRHLEFKGYPLRIIDCGPNAAHWDHDIESRLADAAEICNLLRALPKPLAIFATNDHMGRVACRAASQMGFKIPKDVGVLAVNNLSAARTCDPPLSSIHAPGERVGYRAMEILVGMIKGRPAPPRVEIEPERVYARESTVGKDKETDVARAIELIREGACKGVSVEEIMEEMSMSRSALYREFAATVRRTPAEEISRIRLEKAKELLAKTDVPITAMAGRLGYADPSAFTYFFKNQMGMTPSGYRGKYGTA